MPLWSTVTTSGLRLFQTTLLSVTSAGVNSAVNCAEPPTLRVITPLTATGQEIFNPVGITSAVTRVVVVVVVVVFFAVVVVVVVVVVFAFVVVVVVVAGFLLVVTIVFFVVVVVVVVGFFAVVVVTDVVCSEIVVSVVEMVVFDGSEGSGNFSDVSKVV